MTTFVMETFNSFPTPMFYKFKIKNFLLYFYFAAYSRKDLWYHCNDIENKKRSRAFLLISQLHASHSPNSVKLLEEFLKLQSELHVKGDKLVIDVRNNEIMFPIPKWYPRKLCNSKTDITTFKLYDTALKKYQKFPIQTKLHKQPRLISIPL